MEPHAKYTLVGSIVSALIALTVMVVIWFSKAGSGDQSRPYMVEFKSQSVAGLQQDGAVTMRGIRVGRVKSLRISREDIQLVRVMIDIEGNTPIKTDTEAVIKRNILTGLASIELVNSTQSSQILEPHEDREFAVIPEGKSELDQIASNLPKVIADAGMVLERASQFLSDENQQAVSKTLANIQTVTGRLASDSSNLPELIEHASTLTRSVNDLVSDFRVGGNSVLKELAAALEILSVELRGIGSDLGTTSHVINSTAERLQDPTSLIAGPSKKALGPGEDHD